MTGLPMDIGDRGRYSRPVCTRNSLQEDSNTHDLSSTPDSLACARKCAAFATATPIVTVITGSQQIGRMDLATGSFSPTGLIPPTIQYLVPGPNGSVLTMSFDGNLDSINPNTGAISVIGSRLPSKD